MRIRILVAVGSIALVALQTSARPAPNAIEAEVVELDYPNALLTDYFTLLKVDGKWMIMNKDLPHATEAQELAVLGSRSSIT